MKLSRKGFLVPAVLFVFALTVAPLFAQSPGGYPEYKGQPAETQATKLQAANPKITMLSFP